MSKLQDKTETFRVPPDPDLPRVRADPPFVVPPEDYIITIIADDNVIVIEN